MTLIRAFSNQTHHLSAAILAASLLVGSTLTAQAQTAGTQATTGQSSFESSAEEKIEPSELDKHTADAVKGLWAKASIIYTRGSKLVPEDSEQSATLKSINTLGPKSWTREKVEQLLVVAGVHNKKFKSILVEYINNLPETYAKQVEGHDTGAKNPADCAKAEAQSGDLATQLATIPAPYKERFIKLMGPISRSTKAALIEVSHPSTAEETNTQNTTIQTAGGTRITGQAYFDDIDGLFEETRSQIDKNFSKFSRADEQEDFTKKLLNTPEQEKAMSNDMKSQSSAAVQQIGNYKSGFQQLETIITTPKN